MELIRNCYLVYSNREENSNKVYIVELHLKNDKYIVITKYGRLGNRLVTKTLLETVTKDYAIYEFNKIVDKKKKKGYEETFFEDILSNGNDWFK